MRKIHFLPVLVPSLLIVSVVWSAPKRVISTVTQSVVKPFPKDGEENNAFAKDLLIHALAAYDAAKSFQGAFVVTMTKKRGEGKSRKEDKTEVRMRTSWIVNEQGDKTRENSLIVLSGQEKERPFVQTIRTVDNGQFDVEYIDEEKKWSQSPRNPVSTFRSLFRPIVNAVSSNLINNPVAEPFAEQAVEGGVPVYIVRDKGQQSNTYLRVLFDISNRSLRSFSIGGEGGGVEIFIFDRKFNEPLPDSVFVWKAPNSVFVWKAPKGARQVPAGTLRPNMGIFGNSNVN